MSPTLAVKTVSFDLAGKERLDHGFKQFSSSLEHYEFVASREADIILFLSGGSEHAAIDGLDPNRFYLLIASQYDNAYAAASEVSAWMRSKGIRHMLEKWSPENNDNLIPWLEALSAKKNLQGQRLGIIGSPSPWLVASTPDYPKIKEIFGIEVIELAWDEIGQWEDLKPSEDFLEFWDLNHQSKTHLDASRIYAHLRNVIRKNKLDAISVECFPLASEKKTTACLALAQLNDEGIVASCEGDVVSTLGMMISREFRAGSPSWMANLNGSEDHSLFFSHCTIAPSLTSRKSYDTHFETACSLAVKAELKPGRYTAFRMDQALKQFYITEGRRGRNFSIGNACRTQFWLVVDADISRVNDYTRQPLGNHHILMPGSYRSHLYTLLTMLGMQTYDPKRTLGGHNC